jgi:hypothetical protein
VRPDLAPVLFLRVIELDSYSRVADFFGDDIVGVSFDDALDRGVFVTWDQNESIAMGDDSFVLGRPNVDLFDTGCVVALAVEGEGSLDCVLLRALLDSVIDRPKCLFVPRSAISEVHGRFPMPQLSLSARPGGAAVLCLPASWHCQL